MTTFSDVLDLAHSASGVLTSLEETAKAKTLSHFARYENGVLTYGDLRVEVLRQARTGYVTASSVGYEHMQDIVRESGLPRLDTPMPISSPVLEKVLADIVRNLEAFRDSERGATELRRLRFRTYLSVQLAVRRGFTETQLAVAKATQKQGATLKKVWLCNFTDNVPCHTCMWLHGREIDIDEEFPHGHSERDPKIYHDLQGPTRHPNCRCYMLVYVVTLETNQVVPRAPVLSEERFMSSRDVRRLPKAIYTAAVATLRIIAGKLKGALRGKR